MHKIYACPLLRSRRRGLIISLLALLLHNRFRPCEGTVVIADKLEQRIRLLAEDDRAVKALRGAEELERLPLAVLAVALGGGGDAGLLERRKTSSATLALLADPLAYVTKVGTLAPAASSASFTP